MNKIIDYQRFNIMWKNDLLAQVVMTPDTFKVIQDSNHHKRVFVKPDEQITRADIIVFIKEQIFDKHNANAKKILKELNLDEFTTWGVFRKTHGISDRNRFWVQFEGEDLDYERDIKTRRILHAG